MIYFSDFGVSGGVNSAWSLVEARDCSLSANANQDFTGLAGYDELLIVLNGVTGSGAGADRLIRFSVDNGSTFYSTLSNYARVANTGITTSTTEMLNSGASGTAAQYFFMHIPNTTGQLKMGLASLGTGLAQSAFLASSSRINAVRVMSNSADTLNGGTISIYGRAAPWSLIEARACAGAPATTQQFTGLSAYDEFIMGLDQVGASASSNRRVHYSVDNGSTWISDYQREFTIAGAKTDWGEAQLNSADNAGGLMFFHHLLNATGQCKAGLSLGGREDDVSNDPGHFTNDSSSRVDALRLASGSAATLNSGTIYLHGRALPWSLIEARNCSSSPAANQDFTGLSGYNELLIVMDGVGAAASVGRNLHLSVNNGSSFYTSSGDYFSSMTSSGGKTNSTAAFALSANSSAARYGIIHIPMLTGAVKPVLTTGNGKYSLFVASSSRVDAVRMTSGTADALNSGTLYVYGR